MSKGLAIIGLTLLSSCLGIWIWILERRITRLAKQRDAERLAAREYREMAIKMTGGKLDLETRILEAKKRRPLTMERQLTLPEKHADRNRPR